MSLLLRGAEYRVDRCTTDGALALQGGFTVFHGDFLTVFHFGLSFTFHTIIQVCHGFLPPTSLLEICDALSTRSNGTRQIYFVSLRVQLLLCLSSEV